MGFWRNDDSGSFGPAVRGSQELERVLGDVRADGGGRLVEAADVLLEELSAHVAATPRADRGNGLWSVQDVWCRARTLSLQCVVSGAERRVVDSAVGGGVSVWIEANGRITGELSVYLHRLICTNGMVRKVEGVGHVEAEDMPGWRNRIREELPAVLRGIPTGFDRLGRAAEVRLGLLRPVVPVIVDYLGLADPYRGMVLDAFAAEPGDTLWHFVNAFSRAANLVMVARGLPAEEAMSRRRQLQTASLRVCDELLDRFTEGESLLTIAQEMRGLLADPG